MYTILTAQEKIRISEVLGLYGFNTKNLKIKRNLVGYVNRNFLIIDKNKKYVLRESNQVTSYNHIKLEVALLEYLQKQKFGLTAQIVLNEKKQDITEYLGKYYILQRFLPGLIKGSWNNLDNFTPAHLKSFFAATAGFSKAAAAFKFKSDITNRPLFYFIKNGQALLDGKVKQITDKKIKKLLSQNIKKINHKRLALLQIMKSMGYDSLPKQIVHFDFHPGNMHFKGNKVTGIFDFDWARFDTRVSDIGGAIAQSCYHLKGKKRGEYDSKAIQLALKAYRKAYGRSEFDLETENSLIRIALQASVYFQFLWCLGWYIDSQKHKEGYKNIEFFIKLFLNNNYERIL